MLCGITEYLTSIARRFNQTYTHTKTHMYTRETLQTLLAKLQSISRALQCSTSVNAWQQPTDRQHYHTATSQSSASSFRFAATPQGLRCQFAAALRRHLQALPEPKCGANKVIAAAKAPVATWGKQGSPSGQQEFYFPPDCHGSSNGFSRKNWKLIPVTTLRFTGDSPRHGEWQGWQLRLHAECLSYTVQYGRIQATRLVSWLDMTNFCVHAAKLRAQ